MGHNLLALAGTIAALVFGYLLALAGHPTSVWFFRTLGVM